MQPPALSLPRFLSSFSIFDYLNQWSSLHTLMICFDIFLVQYILLLTVAEPPHWSYLIGYPDGLLAARRKKYELSETHTKAEKSRRDRKPMSDILVGRYTSSPPTGFDWSSRLLFPVWWCPHTMWHPRGNRVQSGSPKFIIVSLIHSRLWLDLRWNMIFCLCRSTVRLFPNSRSLLTKWMGHAFGLDTKHKKILFISWNVTRILLAFPYPIAGATIYDSFLWLGDSSQFLV